MTALPCELQNIAKLKRSRAQEAKASSAPSPAAGAGTAAPSTGALGSVDVPIRRASVAVSRTASQASVTSMLSTKVWLGKRDFRTLVGLACEQTKPSAVFLLCLSFPFRHAKVCRPVQCLAPRIDKQKCAALPPTQRNQRATRVRRSMTTL